MNKNPYVSILTPVYNGQEYLEECIISVLSQTYENWEYVIVNNKSTDMTAEIIDKYVSIDSRIKVHNNTEHLPVLRNLNHSFKLISQQSKYCKVVHADDTIFPDCISRMVKLAETHPSIGIVNAYRISGKAISPNNAYYPESLFSGRDISREFFLENTAIFSAPSNILIQSDLIRKRENVYDVTYLQSDYSACLDILNESDFGFVHELLSFTRRHNNSVTETIALKYSAHMFGYLKIILDYGKFYLNDEEYLKCLNNKIHHYYVQFARNIIHYGFKETYSRHKKELESLNVNFNHLKLITYLLRESILKILKIFKIELKSF